MDEAIAHCTKGLGIWAQGEQRPGRRAGRRDGLRRRHPDEGSARRRRACSAQDFPDLKIRFVNVVDLFKLQPDTEHPHGLSDRDFDSLFTDGQADHLQLPRLPVADPPADLPPHEPPEPARPRLQGEGQHQHAAGPGDPEPDRPLQPGDGRDRPRAARCRWPAPTPRRSSATCRSSARTTPTSTASTSRRSTNWKWPY